MVNILAILVSAITYFILGALWYSPLLFSKQWIKLMGFETSPLKAGIKAMFGKVIGSFLAGIITAAVLAVIIKDTGNQTLTNGMGVGILLWLGFVTTTQFLNWAYANKQKQLYFIDTGYMLVSFVVMGAILGAWK